MERKPRRGAAGGRPRRTARSAARAGARRHRAATSSATRPSGACGSSATLEAIARELCDEVEIRVVRGNRVDGLAQAAAEEGADAIVLGSRPRGARGRQLRCTLARELEAAQSVPVLIAPPATRSAERSAAGPGRSAARARTRRTPPMGFSRLPLLWRVFAINAGLLLAGTLVLVLSRGRFTPRSRSSRLSTSSSAWS